MRYTLKTTLLALMVALPGRAAQAQDEQIPPKLVVVPTKARRGANLKRSAKKYVEKSLEKQYEIIKLNRFKKAARRERIKKRELGTVSTAQTAGGAVGATHVLILEGQMEKEQVGRRKKKVYYANATLVDVSTGDVVFSQRYALKGRRMNRDLAESLVSEVTQALAPPAPEPEPEPEPEPPASPEAPLAPDGGPLDAEGMDSPEPPGEPVDPSLASAEVPVDDAMAPLEPMESDPEVEPGPDAGLNVAALETPPAELKIEAEPTSLKSDRYRPAVSVVAGAIMLRRTGTLTTATAFDKPPSYGGKFFPSSYVAFEIYPLALGGKGSIVEGIGIHGEGSLTQVRTVVNTLQIGDTINSNVWWARGGLSFRYVWWDSLTAPDVRLEVGMSYFEFPLRSGLFPGVKYLSYPYIGAHFNVPLGTEYVALVAGGSYSLITNAGGKTKKLGTQNSGLGGSSFIGEGGVRATIGPLEIRALFRFSQTVTKYSGSSAIGWPTPTPPTFQDLTLTDRYLGIIGGAGVAF